MLILSRKISEKIIIDDDTVITVLDVKNNTVRLGFDAPPEVNILRSELYARGVRSINQEKGNDTIKP